MNCIFTWWRHTSRCWCIYRWAHIRPAPCAACTPCGRSQGRCGWTGRWWAGQTGWSLCCRYPCYRGKPAAHGRGSELRKWEEGPNLLPEMTASQSSYLISPLALHPERRVHRPIQATRHFKSLDVFGRAHATGALSDDSCQTHFLLHIYLFIKQKKKVNR